MEDYSILLGVQLDESWTSEVENQLNSKKFKINVDSSSVDKGVKSVQSIGNAFKNASGHSSVFGDSIKRALGFGSAAAIGAKSIRAIGKAAKDTVDEIKELDETITKLRTVTNQSNETVLRWMRNYNEMGKTLGATTKQVADSAITWMRQGKTVSETNTLIKDSVMLAKNGMIEESEAADFLTTSMKGYKVSVEDAVGIVDRLSKLDTEAAVTAGDLAEGMSNVAQMANDVGVSMDTLLGQLAATGEVIGDVDKVGTALKTIYSRMGDIQAGKLELIDSDGTTELLSNTEITLKNVGIDLRSTVTEFNSYEDVLSSLADKWDSLGSVQQAALSKALAGTRQQNIFRTLMANYDNVRKYAESSANSAGTAEKKFSAYLDSIEAKTNTLKASFESLALNTLSGDTVKGVIEATTAIVTFLDKTNALKGALAGFATYGALKGFQILAGGIKSAYTNLNEFNATLQFLKTLKANDIGKEQIQALANMTSTLSKSQLEAVLSSEALNYEQRMAILTAQGMSTAEAEATLSTMGLANAEGTATGATASFTGALKGLWATLKANPFILIAAGVAAVVMAISAYQNRVKDAADKLKDSADEVSEMQSKVNDLNGELTTTNKRIEELQRKGSLTIVEQNELDKLQSVSSELERQIALRQRALAVAQSKNADNFVNAVNTKMDEDGGNGWWFGYRNYGDFKTSPFKSADHPNRPEVNTTGESEKQKNMFKWRLEDYLEAEKKYQAALKEGNDQEAQQWEERKTQLDTAMDGYVQDLQGYLDDLGEYDYSSLSDGAKEAIDYINDVQNAYLMAVDKNKNSKSVFYNIYDQGRFTEGKQAIEELKEAGTLTAETFASLYNSNDSVKAMIDNMQEVGFINDVTAQSFRGLTNQILSTADALESANKQEKITFDVLISDESTQETINDLKNNLTDLATALEDLRNGDLSDSDILELIEKFPELAGQTDDLDTALSELINTTKEEVGNQFAMWEDNMVSDEDINKLNAVKTALANMGDSANGISKATAEISKLSTALDDLKSTYDTIQDVIENRNENGYFTLDNLQSIMDLEPEYINLLIDENGQINLNNQAYKEYVASKAKSLLVNELQDLYSSILGMKVEEAQAYANAKAYNEETRSVQDLLTATTQLYYAKAMAKDSANNTTAYTDAMSRSFNTAANYAAMVDSYINSLSTPINEFSTATEEATESTNEYKDALEAEKDALEDSKDELENQKDALEDQKEALEDAKEALENYKDKLEDAQSRIQSLIDLTTDYIKQTKEDEKSAIEDQIDVLDKQKDALDEAKDKYADLIDKKKEAIKAAYDEKEAQDELLDKQKSVAKDRLALEVAGLDNSSAGRKAQKQARDNLAESEKSLHEYQDERAYDFQINELEELQTKFEEGIEKRKAQIDGQVEYYKAKIDEIDAYLDNSRQLYEDACAMIDNDTGELYSNLWNYTYQYTTQTKAEFDHLWTSAQEAIQKYIGDNNSLLSTMEWVQLEIYNTETQIGELDGQIDEVQVSIDELDGQIEELDDQISILQDSIDDVSDSVDTQSGKVSDLGSSWSGATTEVSKYIDELNKIPDTTPASSKIPSSHTNDNATFTGIPSNARWYFDYYKNGGRKRAWSSAEDRSTAASDIITEIQRQTGQYRSDVYGGMKHFASGTRHSPTEFISQEKGLEAIFAKNPNGSGSYTLTTPDSQVFDHERTDNLYDFSGDPEAFMAKLAERGLEPLSNEELHEIGWGNSLAVSQMYDKLFNSPDFIKNLTGATGTIYNNDNSASNDVYSCVVNLNIQGVADQTTAQALTKAKKDIKDEMLKELTRLGERNRRMKR